MSTSLAIKGIQNSLLVKLPEGTWEAIRRELIETVSDQEDFFRGARLALQIEDRVLGAAELGELRDSLAERDVTLWAVLSSSEVTQEAAADLGLAREISAQRRPSAPEDEPFDTFLPGEEAVFVERTLRSGHIIRHPGHVVVLGDVNPGAEIIAGGHVIVWGRLRGVVHAGAGGDESAKVCALDLSPTQLRIAGHISVSPASKGQPRPEIASVREGQLVADAWRVKRR